jgi:glycosyltransferase involved in cell wall biosynthesis
MPTEKDNDLKKLKFSIVTVCLNAEEVIEATIRSVLDQVYSNTEYIIIDGLSVDHTLRIIKKYENDIDVIISEKDSGIYDAMNKAIRLCTGGYIQFLNAGDRFLHDHVLAIVSDQLKNTDTDLFVGDVIRWSKTTGLIKYIQYKNEVFDRLFFLKRTINHQGIFTKKTLLTNENEFRTDLRIKSDYYWLIQKIIYGNCSIVYSSIGLVLYQDEGLSKSLYRSVGQPEKEIVIKETYNSRFAQFLTKILSKKYIRVGFQLVENNRILRSAILKILK